MEGGEATSTIDLDLDTIERVEKVQKSPKVERKKGHLASIKFNDLIPKDKTPFNELDEEEDEEKIIVDVINYDETEADIQDFIIKANKDTQNQLFGTTKYVSTDSYNEFFDK